MKTTKSLSILFVLVSPLIATSALADGLDCNPIDDGSSGSVYHCPIDATLVGAPGQPTFASQTFGIVQTVEFKSDLSVDRGKLPQYLQENEIDVPQQTLTFIANTNGTPITLTVTLAPILHLENRNGSPVTTYANLNIQQITGNLPTWINNYIMNKLNSNDEIKGRLVSAGNNLLAKIRS